MTAINIKNLPLSVQNRDTVLKSTQNIQCHYRKQPNYTDSTMTDRYLTFKNLDCDAIAGQVVNRIEYYLNHSSQPSPWLKYFKIKLVERQAMRQDELFFVGSQVNNIRSLFEEFEDVDALNLLEEVEENCC